MQQKNHRSIFVAVIFLKVLFVNLLTDLNFAKNVWKIKNVKNVKT